MSETSEESKKLQELVGSVVESQNCEAAKGKDVVFESFDEKENRLWVTISNA